MIDLEELKLGNVVKYGDGELIIDVNTIRYYNSLIEPILLTPDILKKYGFELLNKGEYYENYGTKNKLYISLCKKQIKGGFNDKVGSWYIGENHVEITSLHWLQNYIYFNYNKLKLITE